AFRATLEEISEADLILHLVDVTHPNARQQIRAVEETLAELNIHDVPTLLAFNKIDALTPEMKAEVEVRLGDLLPQGSVLSALTGAGVGALLERIERMLYADMVALRVVIPYTQGHLISLFHEQGYVERTEHLEEGVKMEGRVPQRIAGRFSAYALKSQRRMRAATAASSTLKLLP
ncbi:MAG: hypothetical protein NZM11_06570, partial [Anaerolineales bacterium]|nr:hypothetical protein [Anaerolineales bacterium]